MAPPAAGLERLDLARIAGALLLPGDPARSGQLLMATAVLAIALLYAGVLAGVRTQSDGITGLHLGMVTWAGTLAVYAILLAVQSTAAGRGFPMSGLLAWLASGWAADVQPAILYFAGCVVSGTVAGILYKHRVLKPMPWAAEAAH